MRRLFSYLRLIPPCIFLDRDKRAEGPIRYHGLFLLVGGEIQNAP